MPVGPEAAKVKSKPFSLFRVTLRKSTSAVPGGKTKPTVGVPHRQGPPDDIVAIAYQSATGVASVHQPVVPAAGRTADVDGERLERTRAEQERISERLQPTSPGGEPVVEQPAAEPSCDDVDQPATEPIHAEQRISEREPPVQPTSPGRGAVVKQPAAEPWRDDVDQPATEPIRMEQERISETEPPVQPSPGREPVLEQPAVEPWRDDVDQPATEPIHTQQERISETEPPVQPSPGREPMLEEPAAEPWRDDIDQPATELIHTQQERISETEPPVQPPSSGREPMLEQPAAEPWHDDVDQPAAEPAEVVSSSIASGSKEVTYFEGSPLDLSTTPTGPPVSEDHPPQAALGTPHEAAGASVLLAGPGLASSSASAGPSGFLTPTEPRAEHTAAEHTVDSPHVPASPARVPGKSAESGVVPSPVIAFPSPVIPTAPRDGGPVVFEPTDHWSSRGVADPAVGEPTAPEVSWLDSLKSFAARVVSGAAEKVSAKMHETVQAALGDEEGHSADPMAKYQKEMRATLRSQRTDYRAHRHVALAGYGGNDTSGYWRQQNLLA